MPQLVAMLSKVTSGTNMLKTSRLHGAKNDFVFEMFSKRLSEIVMLRRLNSIIKKEYKH